MKKLLIALLLGASFTGMFLTGEGRATMTGSETNTLAPISGINLPVYMQYRRYYRRRYYRRRRYFRRYRLYYRPRYRRRYYRRYYRRRYYRPLRVYPRRRYYRRYGR